MVRFTPVVGCALVALAARAEVPVAPPPRAASDPIALVRELGSDEFSEREAAGEKLRALGQKAVSALTAATRNPDPEVARRSADLLKTIEQDARVAFLARFDPDRPVPDHRVWNRFKQLAGDDRAARMLFGEIIRDPKRFARMDQMTGYRPMELGTYHHMLIDTLNAQSRWRGKEPITTPMQGNSVGEIGFFMYTAVCIGGDGDDIISQRGWQLFGRPVMRKGYDFWLRPPTFKETDADARARKEVHPALLRFLLAWAEGRQNPSVASMMFEEARLFAVPECQPLARKWAADAKAPPAVRVPALRLVGSMGDASTDVPLLRGLFADATVVGTMAVPPDRKVVLETRVCDVAVGMALVLCKEDPADHGFPAPKLLPREYQSGPLSPHGLAFPSAESRESAHRTATRWLETRLKAGDK